MNLDQLIKDYGKDWFIRTKPPRATRRQQVGQVDDQGHAYAPGGLTMNLWAEDLADLERQLKEQQQLASEDMA
jgi:hypothetical protein